MKCMKQERKQDHTNERKINLGRKSLGNEVWNEREVFRKERRQDLLREIGEK